MVDSFAAAIDKAKVINAQIVYVKTYSEARRVAQALGTLFWTSKQSEEEQNQAIQHLQNGGTLVATYGLGVGLNMKSRGKSIRRIAEFGCPWSVSACVQAASRIREGGIATVIAWDLREQARSGHPGQKEVASLLVAGLIDEIFDTFGPTVIVAPASVSMQEPQRSYEECREDALLVQTMQLDGTLDNCVICGGNHSAVNCQAVIGLCLTCGQTGHPSKSCPLAKAIPACPNGFCWRCKLPTFAVAGVEMHSGPIGRDCTNTLLAQSVKMMLLCGKANGVKFGPSSDSHFERLRWVTAGSPPNIVTLLARVARQDTAPQVRSATPVLASPSLLSPEQLERIRVNREAALRRRMASPEPGLGSHSPFQALSSPSTATFPPVTLVSTPSQATPARSTPSQSKTTTPLLVTPPTIKQGPKSFCAASKLFDTIGTKLPTVSLPTDRCVRCAGAMHAGACSEPKVNQVLYNAGCCACCALPVRCVHQSW
jgi:hypothetical protein